jgi:2-dehydro-3-deoxyphosphogluconate aldolase/(4S)-4-hydroxy-2-oxoglutarate aldolase
MGIPYIKAVRAPLRHIPMLAVGGVGLDNLADVLATGVWGVGIGSGIVRHDLLARNDYAGITALAKQYTDIVKSVRA